MALRDEIPAQEPHDQTQSGGASLDDSALRSIPLAAARLFAKHHTAHISPPHHPPRPTTFISPRCARPRPLPLIPQPDISDLEPVFRRCVWTSLAPPRPDLRRINKLSSVYATPGVAKLQDAPSSFQPWLSHRARFNLHVSRAVSSSLEAKKTIVVSPVPPHSR